MTPFPHSIDAAAPLNDARKLMDEHGVHHLPVTDEHRLIGILTIREIYTAMAGFKDPIERDKATVRDAYVRNAYIVELDEPLDNVLMTMAERRISSAIVTRKGRLAGMFTAADACRCFGQYLRENFPHSDGDDAA